MAETIFDKLMNKEIPATVVYEDEWVFCFRDINPQAPSHLLVIPRKKDGLTGISQAEPKHEVILGKMLVAAARVAKSEGLDQGYRLVINEGKHGCQ